MDAACQSAVVFLLPYLALTLVCRLMAWLEIIIFYLIGYARAHPDPFIPTSLYPRREDKHLV